MQNKILMYINVGGAASKTANNMPTALQQPLDLELAKEVFRKNYSELEKFICRYRLSIAGELYSAELITLKSLTDANDNSPKADQEKGSALAIALAHTINDRPHLLKKLIEIMEKNDFELDSQDIIKKLKKGLKPN